MDHSRGFEEDSSRIRVVLFDYDDTLVRTRECRFEAIREAGRRACEYAPTDAALEEHWGIPYRRLFEQLFAGRCAAVDDVIRAYESLGDEFPMQPHDGAIELLTALRASRPVGIITSAGRAVVEPQLAAMGLPAARLRWLQTAEDTEHHKPDPRVFDAILGEIREQGVLPHEVLYVGDAWTDYEGARDAGMEFAGVPRSQTHRERMHAAGVRYVLQLERLGRWLLDGIPLRAVVQ